MTVTTESKLIPMKWIVTLAYVWLAIPVILFLINWVNLTVNALLALMIIYVGASAFIRRQKEKKTSAISLPAQDFSPALKLDPTLVFTGATLLFLVIYMGIGGLMTQEYNDQVFRNAMLYEVTNRDWPIIYPPIDGNPCFLSYYMGFWLPAAAVAKIFGGNMLVAESVTIFYAWTGLFLFIAFIFSYVGERRRLLALLVILMFAAFDYVAGAIFTYRNYPDIISFIGGNHDNATTYYALPNIAVALGQIYNQAIPAFLGCMLLYYQRNSFRYFFLTFALVMFFSPLQCVGIFPVCAVWGIRNFRNTLSAANILGILLCFLFAAYFMANNQGSMRLRHRRRPNSHYCRKRCILGHLFRSNIPSFPMEKREARLGVLAAARHFAGGSTHVAPRPRRPWMESSDRPFGLFDGENCKKGCGHKTVDRAPQRLLCCDSLPLLTHNSRNLFLQRLS